MANLTSPKLDKACEFLLHILADGDKDTNHIAEEAQERDQDFSSSTLRQAKIKLGVTHYTENEITYWRAPRNGIPTKKTDNEKLYALYCRFVGVRRRSSG